MGAISGAEVWPEYSDGRKMLKNRWTERLKFPESQGAVAGRRVPGPNIPEE